MIQKIRSDHQASHETYGAPQIHAELADEGTRVGRKRVARLMRAVAYKVSVVAKGLGPQSVTSRVGRL